MDKKVETVQEGRYVKQSFNMRLKGTTQVYPVVINHTLDAVKIGSTVFKQKEFDDLMQMGPTHARAVLAVAEKLDGDVLDHETAKTHEKI